MHASPVRSDLVEERFFAKVDRRGTVPEHATWLGPCWLWTAHLLGNGYGQFRGEEGLVLAHRWVVERVVGRRLLPTEHVDHLCHDPAVCVVPAERCPHRACVNVAHLAIRSAADNNARSGSVTARNARKEVCDAGHPLEGANVYLHPQRGTRHCRTCQRRRAQEYEARQALARGLAREQAAGGAQVIDLAARRALGRVLGDDPVR